MKSIIATIAAVTLDVGFLGYTVELELQYLPAVGTNCAGNL